MTSFSSEQRSVGQNHQISREHRPVRLTSANQSPGQTQRGFSLKPDCFADLLPNKHFPEKRNGFRPRVIESRLEKSSENMKPLLWNQKYIMKGIPSWVYSDHREPASRAECKAKISALEYQVEDIEIQIEMKNNELERFHSVNAAEEFMRWKSGALRAKKGKLFLQSVYKYWLLLNSEDDCDLGRKIRKIIEILVENPEDEIDQLRDLL